MIFSLERPSWAAVGRIIVSAGQMRDRACYTGEAAVKDFETLFDVLYAHGFCSSYFKVLRSTDIPYSTADIFQFMADSVDQNINTLDGNSTYHGMGIIATVTTAKQFNVQVPRQKVVMKIFKQQGELILDICHFHD